MKLKVGDLISHKPRYLDKEHWSNPSIVLKCYWDEDGPVALGEGRPAWIATVWTDGDIREINYIDDDIIFISQSPDNEEEKNITP